MSPYLSEWRSTDEPDRERGQMFGAPRGLCYAVEGARQAIAQGASIWECITDTATGEVIYDSRTGIDNGDRCPQCSDHGWCQDPSGHFSHEYDQPAEQWYPSGGVHA